MAGSFPLDHRGCRPLQQFFLADYPPVQDPYYGNSREQCLMGDQSDLHS